MNFISALVYSVISSIIISLPLKIIEKLFTIDNICTKFLGYLLFSSILLVCFYVSFTIAALVGIDKANEWAFNYLTSFSLDFFILNPLLGYILVSLYYFSEKKSNFIEIIINKLLKNKIQSAKNDEI
jgi:hypothetical protein